MTAPSVNRAPRPSSLADVLDVVLDKGIVLDAYVRVALLGVELVTIDARVVIASVDTYLRFAEAVNRLDLSSGEEPKGLPALMEEGIEGAAKTVVKRKLSRPAERVEELAERAGERVEGFLEHVGDVAEKVVPRKGRGGRT